MINVKDNIKVTIGQAHHPGEFDSLFDFNKRIRYKKPSDQLEKLFKAIDTAKQDHVDFVLLPELFLPRQYLYKHVRTICKENSFIMIGGLEYGPGYINETDKHTPLRNEAFIAIPSSINGNENSHETNTGCTILEIPKILPAEEEERMIHKHGYKFDKGNKIYLFQSQIVGNWAVLICVDVMNLPIQVLLQAKIQTLFLVAYNTDVDGYSSIADSLHRLLMCNVVICNTGYYGSSLAYSPFRTKYKRDVIRITGNKVDVAVTISLPIKSILLAQNGVPINEGDPIMIKRPPDFGKFQIVHSTPSND
jgi:hypothetical protein